MDMSQLPSPLHVIVIGAGLGGLCLAQGLRKAGISVAVYERDPSPLSRTQGYRVHIDAHGEQALRECLPPTLYELFLATRGQDSLGLTVFGEAGGELKEVARMRFPEGDSGQFVTIGSAVDRLTLRQILLAGLDDVIHFGKEFTHYEHQADGTVRAYFADGMDAVGDVLVGACGVNSRIREQLLPEASVIDTGTRWLGGKTMLTDELKALLPAQLAETFGAAPVEMQSMLFGLVMFRQNPNQAAAHLFPEIQFQDSADYIFWGIIVQQAHLAISDDALNALDGPSLHQLALSLSVNWPAALHALIEQCKPDQTFALKIRSARPIEHWQTTNITLLGDAIHVMPPNGSGANTALRDARELARRLSSATHSTIPLLQALHDYESEMLRYGFDALRASLQRGAPFTPAR